MQYISARNYTKAMRSKGDVDYVVIHDMEMPEKNTTAESCARYFSTTTTQASAHYCIDNNSTVQCVQESDVAWAAPGANSTGVQLELAGYASQSRGQWLDSYSIAVLDRTAALTAAICKRWDIPVQFVDAAGLKKGRRGITTHLEVSRAFRKSTHTDPGAGFPMDVLISKTSYLYKGPTTPIAVDRKLVSAGGYTFATFFPKWTDLGEGQRYWAEVIALQYKLNTFHVQLGTKTGLVLDGLYGPKTQERVVKFQRWAGTTRTDKGVVRKPTAIKLGLTR